MKVSKVLGLCIGLVGVFSLGQVATEEREILKTDFHFFSLVHSDDEFHSKLEENEKEAKSTLVVFLNEKNCPWSEKVLHEVLENDLFHSQICQLCHVLIVPFDDAIDLRGQLNVKETPYFLLFSSKGEEISRESFLPLTAEGYADHFLDSLREYARLASLLNQKELLEEDLKAMYVSARQYGFAHCKEQIFNRGILNKKNLFFLLEQYESWSKDKSKKDPELLRLRKKIQSLDPKNLQGAQLKLAMCDFSNQASKVKSHKTSWKMAEPLLRYVAEFGKKDKENLWKVEMMLAQFFFSKNEMELAVEHAELSHEAAPDMVKEEIAQTVSYIKSIADSIPSSAMQ